MTDTSSLPKMVGYVGSVPDSAYPRLSSSSMVYQKGDQYFVSWYVPGSDRGKDLGLSLEEFEEAISKGQATRFSEGDTWSSGFTGSLSERPYLLYVPMVYIFLEVRGSFKDFICKDQYPAISHRGATLLILDHDSLVSFLAEKSAQLTPELLAACTEDELRVLSCGLPFNEMLAQARVDRASDPVRKERVQRTINLQREAAAKHGFFFPSC